MALIILLIIFTIGSLMVKHRYMGKPRKTNFIANKVSNRLPMVKIISSMTNIIATIMLNSISVPDVMFFVTILNVLVCCLNAENFTGP